MEAVAILLTYSLTLSLTVSDGAWGLLAKIRNNERMKDFGLFECFMCVSLWVSMAVAIVLGDPILFAWGWGGSIIVNHFFTWLFTK